MNNSEVKISDFQEIIVETYLDFPLEPVKALNAHALRLLEEYSYLKDNWDEDDALKPNMNAIQLASKLVKDLELAKEKVFHVAPGPNGEIMVDIRKNKKSVEIIFYPTKVCFVKFPIEGIPEQGIYDESNLKKLLNWLNG
jgi:hypothetical protein